MNTTRRSFARNSSLGLLTTSLLAPLAQAASTVAASSLFKRLQDAATGKSEGLLLKAQPGEEGPPEPATAMIA